MTFSPMMIGLLALAPLLAGERAAGAQAPRPTPPSDAALRRTIDEWIAPLTPVLSGTLLVSKGGRVIYERAFGFANFEHRVPFTISTPTNVASISKPLTLVALDRMIDEGRLALTDTVSRWLPTYRHGHRMTVGQLASHRAGVPHRLLAEDAQSQPRTATDMVRIANGVELLFEPGARGSYSSGGFAILAAVLERAGGAEYDEILRTYVGGPSAASMIRHTDARTVLPGRANSVLPTAAGYINAPLKDLSFLVGGGSVYSTPRDIDRFMTALVTGRLGARARTRLVSGTGFRWNGVTGGYRAFADYYAADTLNVLFFGNAYVGAIDVVRNSIPGMVAGRPVMPASVPAVQPASINDAARDRVAGRYATNALESAPFEFISPTLAMFGNRAFVPVNDTMFFSLADWITVAFRSGADGRISAMEWGRGPSDTAQGPRFPRVAVR